MNTRGNELPGQEYLPVAYNDNDVCMREGYGSVHVYVYTTYNTPLRGVLTHGWLSAGTWETAGERYYEIDGIGRGTGRTAGSLSEVAEYVRSR